VKIANLILRLIVGGVFIASAVTKVWNVQYSHAHGIQFSHVPDLTTFSQDVANYHVPPRALTNLVAITLPWIELLAGALLVFGIWKRASAMVITAMMVVFLIAISQAVIRGFNINCGCFGSVDARKVGVTALAEDVVLLGMAAWLAWRLKDGSTASNGGNQ
jgi:putative oxidoreductase